MNASAKQTNTDVHSLFDLFLSSVQIGLFVCFLVFRFFLVHCISNCAFGLTRLYCPISCFHNPKARGRIKLVYSRPKIGTSSLNDFAIVYHPGPTHRPVWSNV